MAARIEHGGDEAGLVATIRVDGAAAATPVHAHRSLIVGLVDAGRREVALAHGTLDLRAGDGFVIPPDTAHAFAATADGAHRVLALDATAFRCPPWQAGLIRDDGWARRFDAAFAAVATGSPDLQALADALLDATDPLVARTTERCLPVRSVRLARRVVSDDLDRPVDLKTLARRVGLSAWHLHRLYRRTFGLTPAEHRLEARLRLARQLIGSGAAIADVAAALGFADQSHLSRAFRKLMGVPPGTWARQMQASRRPRRGA